MDGCGYTARAYRPNQITHHFKAEHPELWRKRDALIESLVEEHSRELEGCDRKCFGDVGGK